MSRRGAVPIHGGSGRAQQEETYCTFSWVTSVETPLVVLEWQRLLQQHPTRCTRYVLDGIQHVPYWLQIWEPFLPLSQGSAMENPEVVDQYLAKEVGLRRVLGPVAASMLPTASVSSFGVIPKPHQGSF